MALKDLKEALGARSKPDITHIRTPLMVYGSRACEYGNDKYERANYLRPVGSTKEAFERYRKYLRAGVSHLVAILDEMEWHQANDPDLQDEEGMKRAAFAADTDEGLKFPASGLPHFAHAVASLNMCITQAVQAELLPPDPHKPWAEKLEEQKSRAKKVTPPAPPSAKQQTRDGNGLIG